MGRVPTETRPICIYQYLLILIFSGVFYASVTQGFAPFHTSSTLSAMKVATLVTGSSLRIIYARLAALTCNIGFCRLRVRSQHLNSRISSGLGRFAHCAHKLRTAVWVYGMVAPWLAIITYFSPSLSAIPAAMESIIPLRNGTTVDFIFSSA